MSKSLHEFKERRIKEVLGGLSFPMIYVRQSWYADQNENTERYRDLQQRMRKDYPELIRRLTTPPWPYAATQLAEHWNSMSEQDRRDVGSLHALLYMRLEWFAETILRKDNSTGPLDPDYERMYNHYQKSVRGLLQ